MFAYAITAHFSRSSCYGVVGKDGGAVAWASAIFSLTELTTWRGRGRQSQAHSECSQSRMGPALRALAA